MSDDEKGAPPKSEFDRMSLASLKRELSAQQATTEQAREAAKARLREDAERARAFPWRTLAIVIVGGSLFFVLVAFALQASFPEVADLVIPDFVYHPYDGGPPREPPDAGPRHHEAGSPDAGHPSGHHAHHGAGATDGTGAGTGAGGDLDLDTTGGTDDPLEGL